MSGIARETAYGKLVIDNANRNPISSETANDSQSMKIAANHDSANFLARRKAPVLG